MTHLRSGSGAGGVDRGPPGRQAAWLAAAAWGGRRQALPKEVFGRVLRGFFWLVGAAGCLGPRGWGDPLVPVTPSILEPGRQEVVATTGLGIATSDYDVSGHAAAYPGDARYLQLVTAFRWRFSLLADAEGAVQAPVVFNVYSLPASLTRQSGGGLGDVSAWAKYRWYVSPSLSSAVWVGMKWPTGKWTGLDPLKQGTDRTGTGSQDWLFGMAASQTFEWGRVHVNLGYAITNPKSLVDAEGALVDQDDGDLTSVVLAATIACTPEAEVTVPVIFENTGRVRQNGVPVDQSSQQWLAIRPALEVRLTPEVVLEPSVEFPFRGVNRQRVITLFVNFHYEF